jgi:hypothetical protein
LGEADGDGGTTYRDPRNRSLNKTLLGFHRTHALTSNGTWTLPFGPNQKLLNNVPGWAARVVAGWQLGGILTLSSGSPMSVSTGLNLIHNSSSGSTPNIVGAFPKSAGQVTMTGALPNYFADLKQIEDPSRAGVTTLQAVQNQFSNKAITDANGNLLLANPAPGTLGTLGMNTLEGPGNVGLDMNLSKRVRITETKNIELRVNAINILNTPNWNNPETSINSNNFGQITGASGSREFTTTLRFNF